jgi:hypothetical protein
MNLWLRFEEQGDFVSQFAKQLDIYQAMEKASEYEKAGEPVTAKEFIDYSEKDITHPVLVQRIKMLKGE